MCFVVDSTTRGQGGFAYAIPVSLFDRHNMVYYTLVFRPSRIYDSNGRRPPRGRAAAARGGGSSRRPRRRGRRPGRAGGAAAAATPAAQPVAARGWRPCRRPSWGPRACGRRRRGPPPPTQRGPPPPRRCRHGWCGAPWWRRRRAAARRGVRPQRRWCAPRRGRAPGCVAYHQGPSRLVHSRAAVGRRGACAPGGRRGAAAVASTGPSGGEVPRTGRRRARPAARPSARAPARDGGATGLPPKSAPAKGTRAAPAAGTDARERPHAARAGAPPIPRVRGALPPPPPSSESLQPGREAERESRSRAV